MDEPREPSVPSPRRFPQYRFRVPEGATDLLLVRHGQSAPMPADTFPANPDGHADPPLSEEGRHQAELLAQRLGTAALSAIYVSSLRRTHETAAPLAERTGLTPRLDADLREVHLGAWEGGEFRRRSELRDPRLGELFRDGDWSIIPGAESGPGFADRVRVALLRIQAAHSGERVAVICHGGVIGQAVALASGFGPLAFLHSDNASISQVIMHGDHWIVRRFNDTAHLGPAFTAEAAPPQ